MSPSFPNEVLEIIVDELAISGVGPWKGLLKDVKSCSLVSKIFVPMCRKHIFQSLTLHPGRKSQAGKILATDTKEKWAEFMLRYSALAVHPGVYVRRLRFYTGLEDPSRLSDGLLMEALRRLPNLAELDLRADDGWGGIDFWGCDLVWRTSILYLIQNPKLKSLTIRNITLPMEILLWCTGLEKLDVREAWLPGPIRPRKDPAVQIGWPQLLRPDRPGWRGGPEHQQVYPRSLVIDSASGVDCGLFRGESGDLKGLQGILNPERVQKLDLTVEGFDDYGITQRFFESAKSLRELKLEMRLEPTRTTTIPEFPVKSLHPASLKTLTHLQLDIMMTRLSLSIPLDDPYIGFCSTLLPNLMALKKLTLSVWVIEIAGYHVAPFGEQWGSLDRALAPHGLGVCLLPVLKHVQVAVWAKVWQSWEPRGWGECVEDAEEFIKNVNMHVYPQQFPGLLRLSREGALAFAFESGLKLASLKDPDARTTVQRQRWPRD